MRDDGTVIIGTGLDTKSFDNQIEDVRRKLEEIDTLLVDPEIDSDEFIKLNAEAERLNNQLRGLVKQKENLENAGTNQWLNVLEKQGDATEKIIHKVGRWAIAVFGVRSAYSFLRNSISTISQYNSQVATDIEYIRFALASSLEPVVLRIISLVKTLLGYIGYIAKAWFNVDLFAGASVDKFKQNEKSLGGATKQAKELNKQLSKFDEMNVLQDQSDTGGGGASGGGAGGNMPSFDLSGIQGEVPSWIKWIAENKEPLLAGFAGIIGFLKSAPMLMETFGKKAGLIKALGIGIAIAGIVYLIQGLLDYLKDPTWENFGKIIQGIGTFIIGLGIIIENVPLIVIGAVVLIVGTIVKYWDKIKEFLIKGVEWLEGSVDKVKEFFGERVAKIYETWITAFKGIIIGFDTLFGGLKKVLDGIIQFVKGVFTGNWKQAWEGVKKIFEGIFQAIAGIGVSIFSFIAGLVVSIGQEIGNIISDAFKLVVNVALGAIENILNSPIKAINGLIGIINKVPGINLEKLPTFKLPRLAQGGIINQPGRGIAVGGERGAEGVIPLTDSQQMALLGEAIGKYITINANITNTMNGRVISRELQKVQNENNFAYNR